MHTVFALLCFVVVIHWLIFPYPSGLLHWHCGNLAIAPVPAKQPWRIWINTSCEFIMNDCITTTKQSTTKPCAYFLGYTVPWHLYKIRSPFVKRRAVSFKPEYFELYLNAHESSKWYLISSGDMLPLITRYKILQLHNAWFFLDTFYNKKLSTGYIRTCFILLNFSCICPHISNYR